jgi:hypothetical protein
LVSQAHFQQQQLLQKPVSPPSTTVDSPELNSVDNMESPNRVERKVSFNPEAAAFSPTTMAVKQAEDLAASTGTAEHRSPGFGGSATPRRNYVESSLRHVTYQDAEDSPFGSQAKGKRPVRHGQASSSSPAPLQLQDLLDKGIPLEALMRTLGGE